MNISLGIVQLESGQRVTAQIEIPNPKTGMKVKGQNEVVRQDDCDKHPGMVFYEDG